MSSFLLHVFEELVHVHVYLSSKVLFLLSLVYDQFDSCYILHKYTSSGI